VDAEPAIVRSGGGEDDMVDMVLSEGSIWKC